MTRGRFRANSNTAIWIVLLGLVAVMFTLWGAVPPRSRQASAAGSDPPTGTVSSDGVSAAYARQRLSFVPNTGQGDDRVRFTAQASGADFFFTPQEAVFRLPARGNAAAGLVLRLGFVGADPSVRVEGRRLAAGAVNYLVGSDPAQWRTGIPTYARIVYRDLWPGIDFVFRGNGESLKYEFRLAPGAQVGDIRLTYQGADRLDVGPSGHLAIQTALGMLRDTRPVAHQVVDGRRVPVASRYHVGQGSSYGFVLDAGHDPRRPLVIDPGLVFSTFLGGASFDDGEAIALDPSGDAYVAGWTRSVDFPTTAGAFDATADDSGDVFVAKLSADGSTLLYSTILGGTENTDRPTGVAVDGSGDAYVTGATSSADFPTTAGAFDNTSATSDAFVTKLSRDGSELAYSTFLGGTGFDGANGVSVDPAGHAYITGSSLSADFPTTAGAPDTTLGGDGDAFVTKMDRDGAALVYSTLLGGSSREEGVEVAVDPAGSAYVAGVTASADFPTTTGAFDTTLGDSTRGGDGFVTKLGRSGAVRYSTFLGGTSRDDGTGIVVDPSGEALVSGWTRSADFPTTPGAFDTTFAPDVEAFVTKLNRDGSAPVYSTFLGGSSDDLALAIAVDPPGHAYITGQTGSRDFPTTASAFDTSLSGIADAFVTTLSPDGSAVVYSTFLGGSHVVDLGTGIAVAGGRKAAVIGNTESRDFPTTTGAFDTIRDGLTDAFVATIDTR